MIVNSKRVLVFFFLAVMIVLIPVIWMITAISDKRTMEYDSVEEIDAGTEFIQFVSDGKMNIYSIPVSLMKGDAFLVSYSVSSGIDEGTIITDLYSGPFYDSPDIQFQYHVLEGDHTVSGILKYGGDHPIRSNIRIYSTGDTSAKISSLNIERVSLQKSIRDIFPVLVLIICAAAVVVICYFFIDRDSKEISLSAIEKKRVVWISLLFVIMLQILLMIFWLQQKSNFYVDEFYSMERAQFYTVNSPGNRHMYEDESWKTDTWMEIAQWKDTLILSQEESVFTQPAYQTVLSLIRDRNYNGFLNMMESIISRGMISKYPGILLNILLFSLVQIVLFLLLQRMQVSPTLSIFAVFWHGFCGMTVSMVEYVRFYVLTELFCLIILYLHLVIWSTENRWKLMFSILGVMLCAYVGYKDSELVILFFLLLTVSFTVVLLIRKRFHRALCYGVPVFGIGIAYGIIKLGIVDIILHSSEYAERAGAFQGLGDVARLEEVIYNFYNMSVSTLLTRMIATVRLFVESMIGGWFFFIGLILLWIVTRLLARKEILERDMAFLMARILLFIVIGYSILMVIGFDAILRYFSPLSLPVIICTLVAWEKRVKNISTNLISVGLVTIVTLGMLYTHVAGNIAYIYQDDRAFYESIEKYQITDSIVDQSAASFQCPLYDCVYHLDPKAFIYPTMRGHEITGIREDQEQVLLWTFPGSNISSYVRDMGKKGYQYTKLGQSESSEVYLFQKQ